ncbi:hypothetical protein BJV82DRAFT_675748 [Fennellomyces sp. T-0311]|nr:hypothetical protein BJV82DRAFT_675748 [Fennellomyces sp. T-0311]
MPPKKSSTATKKAKSVQDEFAEIHRQITALNQDVQTMFTKIGSIENLIKAEQIQRQKDQDNLMSFMHDFKDAINAAISTQGISSESPATNQPTGTLVENVIAEPTRTLTKNGKRQEYTAPLWKCHILNLVITPTANSMSAAKVNSLYNSVKKERKAVLNVLVIRLGIVIKKIGEDVDADDDDEEDGQGEDEENMEVDDRGVEANNNSWTWQQLDQTDRATAICAFEQAVFDNVGIDFSRCAGHWASEHMLDEGWSNKLKNKTIMLAEQSTRQESVNPNPESRDMDIDSERQESILRALAGNMDQLWDSRLESSSISQLPLSDILQNLDSADS